MIEFSYDNFYIVCIPSKEVTNEILCSSYFFIGSHSKTLDFIANTDKYKQEYISYWHTNKRKDCIAIYDEIIENHDLIIMEVSQMFDYTFFVRNKHKEVLNPLNELDFLVESNRIQKVIEYAIKKCCNHLHNTIDVHLCNLEKSTESKLRRNYLNFDASLKNLNRKIESTIITY